MMGNDVEWYGNGRESTDQLYKDKPLIQMLTQFQTLRH